MARVEGDTWDLASSVGATATMVAAARAIASAAPDPVINDQFAAPLVRAVGVDFFTKLVDGELTEADLGDDPSMNIVRFANGMAARTRFFDEFFDQAVASGVRQAVILASGLDARAYRLDWPAGTVVYEIDQPEVIEFKTRTLTDLGARPTTERRTVAVDLRDDWVSALLSAGFDPAAPTAWIAEGLFGYLPSEAQDRLLELITENSAPGSWVAAEAVPSTGDVDMDEVRERMQSVTDKWSEHGFDLDFSELVYIGDRTDAATHLDSLGWKTSAVLLRRLFCHRRRHRHPAGRHPGVRPGHPALPVGLARGHRRLRDRPARGHRVQESVDGGTRCVALGRTPHRRDRPA